MRWKGWLVFILGMFVPIIVSFAFMGVLGSPPLTIGCLMLLCFDLVAATMLISTFPGKLR